MIVNNRRVCDNDQCNNSLKGRDGERTVTHSSVSGNRIVHLHFCSKVCENDFFTRP